VRHGYAAKNPVTEIERPAINRDEGTTLAFAKTQARKLLDTPADDTLDGLRDRAILSVGLQVGLRRAEIAALKVGDLHQNRGFDSLRVTRKGGRRDALAINPQTAARLHAYLERAGHADDVDGPLFRPLHHNWQTHRAAAGHGPGRNRRRGAEICWCRRAAARLFGTFDAGDLHHHRAGVPRDNQGESPRQSG
jgi:integrase